MRIYKIKKTSVKEFKKIVGEYIEMVDLSRYSRSIYFVEMITEKSIFIKKRCGISS